MNKRQKEAARLRRHYDNCKRNNICVTCRKESKIFVRCLECRRELWDKRNPEKEGYPPHLRKETK